MHIASKSKHLSFTYIGVLLFISTILTTPAVAVHSGAWFWKGFQDINKGKWEGLQVDNYGVISLAQKLSEFTAIKSDYVWCVLPDGVGNLYVGTGDQGIVFHLTVDGEVRMLFDSTELEILSLAIDKKGNLYAGTSPTGMIYKIPRNGTPETYFLTGESSVWALSFGPDGNLFAATGDKGKIFKITKANEGEVYYDTPDAHVMCLTWHEEKLYAGTFNRGMVYEIEDKDKARALFDSPTVEVHNIAFDSKGTLYFSIISGEYGKHNRPIMPPGPGKPHDSNADNKGKDERGMVAVIEPDGYFRGIWECPETPLTTMTLVDDMLYVACSNDGRLYRVNPETTEYVMLREPFETPITNILARPKGVFLLNAAVQSTIYKLEPEMEKEGTYTSNVYDGTNITKWGRLRWTGKTPAGSIEFQVRKGNSEKPDDTWGEWSEKYDAEEGFPIELPASRFIQWKADFKGEKETSPSLEEVEVSMFQPNRQPRITEVTVYPRVKGVFEPGSRPGGSTITQKLSDDLTVKYIVAPGHEKQSGRGNWTPLRGMRTVGWKSYEPDGDRLVYNVYLKGEGEDSWRMLGEEVKDTYFSFDTSILEDGKYSIKIETTDKLSNPFGAAMKHEAESDLFTVDNVPPDIKNLDIEVKKNMIEMTAEAIDETSNIMAARISIDNQDWLDILPADEIYDAKVEKFKIVFNVNELRDKSQLHTLSLEIFDTDQNVAVKNNNFKIKR